MKYRTLVADPPWDVHRLESPGAKGFGTGAGVLRSVALPYPTMDLDAIKDIPVESIAESDAHLYLWTINAYVEHAYDVARAWGFRPSTLLVWCKSPMGLGPGGAYSITTEYVLFCRRGALAPLARQDSTWWQWKRREHSAKPEHFYDLVEQVSPGPYVELFARRHRLGWDVWGNESANTAQLEARGMSAAQDTLFRWGHAAPSVGECCGCQRLPVERFRFNLIVEDAFSRQSHTQLLCRSCISELLCTLVGQSVEPTPQSELNQLDELPMVEMVP